jgi:hypothetical protein
MQTRCTGTLELTLAPFILRSKPGSFLGFFLFCRSVSETGITQAGADRRRSRRNADLGLDSLIVIISLLPKFCDATIWEGVPAGKVPRPRGIVQVKGTLNLESYDCFMEKDARRTARCQ